MDLRAALNRPYAVNMVSLHMRHHASASGYDQLSRYIPANVIQASQRVDLWARLISKLCARLISGSGLQYYNRNSFLAELSVAKLWLTKRRQVFHYLYGENHFRYSAILRRLRKDNVIICSYHTPEQRFMAVVNDREFIRNVHAIIILSEVQRKIFEGYIPDNKIFLVPHGIDTIEYSPAIPQNASLRRGLRCIAVGSHMRDYETLASSIRLLAESGHEVSLDIVARENQANYFSDIPNVHFYSGVSDHTLIEMYRNADALVLPLLDATANNSLLEAMACGLPIICTDLPGIHDYVDDGCAILVPKGDANGLCMAIASLIADKERLATMSRNSRTKALEFDWHRIAEKTLAVYDAVWAELSPS